MMQANDETLACVIAARGQKSRNGIPDDRRG